MNLRVFDLDLFPLPNIKESIPAQYLRAFTPLMAPFSLKVKRV
jgi:hypothetical protein